MKEKSINASETFDIFTVATKQNEPVAHPDDCECVECATKKWTGDEYEILDRANSSPTQKEIYERSRKSDREFIDSFNEANKKVLSKAGKVNEKKFAVGMQKALIYITALMNFPLIFSLMHKLMMTQDYISCGLHIVSLLVINYINDKIH